MTIDPILVWAMQRNPFLVIGGLTLFLLVRGIFFPLHAFTPDPLSSSARLASIPVNTAQKPDNPSQQIVTAQNQFGFRLFSQLSSQSNNNLFISPTSMAIALSLLYNGASGQTQQEMTQVLALQGMSLKEINMANKSLISSLNQSKSAIQVNIANSLWARQGFSFRHAFLQTSRRTYQAEVTSLDFKRSEAVEIINNWVNRATNGKISKIIAKINPEDVLFLMNAIYFKGNWQEAFDPALTEKQPFYLINGQSKSHPLMSRRGRFQYYETNDFQAVSLPYAQGKWRFYVFVPRENRSLKSFSQTLTAQNWQLWLKQFREREGLVKIPRFRLNYEANLNQSLQALGMKTAFDASQANFSQMTSNSVKVSEIKHKTYVEVNEKGTEAAGVTSIGISVTSVPLESESFTLIVNRPFFCAIQDTTTGAIVFMGSVTNP